ncbi:MAG: DNA repair protein RecN [Bacteroidota bacterium]
MLVHLSVKNYVLIDSLEVNFGPGLTTVTGETGAGKSILLGALGLILGERADTDTLFVHDKKCVIEGVFQIAGYAMENVFTEHDLDYDSQTIIRREILTTGKSRAFVNDTPVKLKFLKQLGDLLINIHSQHATLTLNRPDFQISVLDDFAGNKDLLEEYRCAYFDYRDSLGHLKMLQNRDKEAKKEQDFYRFLFEELDKAKLKESEKEELEAELKQLNHAEEIKESLYASAEQLSRSEDNLLDRLRHTGDQLGSVSSFHDEIDKYRERLESCRIELQDIAAGLEALEENTEYDPRRLEYVNERLDTIYSLEQKHQVEGTAALLALQQNFDKKLQDIDSLEQEIEQWEKLTNAKKQNAFNVAGRLQKLRRTAAPELAKEVEGVLALLNMEGASVKLSLHSASALYERGLDHVELLFSANKGQKPGPVNKVASGGELSRLMLTFKSILSDKKILPTIIFDEIDTGVSGNAAARVGEIMAEMGRKMQVITITHLPQIAARGNRQLKVFKHEKNSRTQTGIRELDKESRIKEIATMISGEEKQQEAVKTARQLISG